MSQPEANPDEIVLVLEEIRPIPARQRIVMDQDTKRAFARAILDKRINNLKECNVHYRRIYHKEFRI